MGIIATYTCNSCDFESGNLFIGLAPDPEQYEPVLASCSKCGRLLAVHKPDLAKGCPEYRGELRRVSEDDLEAVPCPRCGSKLKLEPFGLWD